MTRIEGRYEKMKNQRAKQKAEFDGEKRKNGMPSIRAVVDRPTSEKKKGPGLII